MMCKVVIKVDSEPTMTQLNQSLDALVSFFTIFLRKGQDTISRNKLVPVWNFNNLRH